MTIIWDPAKMSTGMPIIDAEHQEWIRRFNAFEAAITTGQGATVVLEVLNFMVEYAETHFVNEEMLAGEGDAPIIQRNRAEHNRFRQNVNEIRKRIKVKGTFTLEVISLQIDLSKWLVQHICFVDRQIWPVANFIPL